MLSGYGQRLDLGDAGNPPQILKIAILAIQGLVRS